MELYRKKAIGLDDLLSDFYGGKKKTVENFSRHFEVSNGYDSDEDDKRVAQNETYLRKFVEDCEKQASVNFLPFFSHNRSLYRIFDTTQFGFLLVVLWFFTGSHADT